MPPLLQPSILYLVDNDGEFARSLSTLLSALDLSVEVRSSAEEFLAAFDTERAACVLIDMNLPGMSGVELVRHIRQLGVRIPLVLMAAQTEAGMAAAAIESGASDLLQKPFDGKAIGGMLNALQAAMVEGPKARIPGALPAIHVLRERFDRLTSREREVAQLVAKGYSSKELARALRLSKRTVDNYRAHILEKMGLDNSVQVTRSIELLRPETSGAPHPQRP